jgi:hypothetical protein
VSPCLFVGVMVEASTTRELLDCRSLLECRSFVKSALLHFKFYNMTSSISMIQRTNTPFRRWLIIT